MCDAHKTRGVTTVELAAERVCDARLAPRAKTRTSRFPWIASRACVARDSPAVHPFAHATTGIAGDLSESVSRQGLRDRYDVSRVHIALSTRGSGKRCKGARAAA